MRDTGKMVKPSPTRSQSAAGPRAPLPSASVRRFSSGGRAMSSPHAGIGDEGRGLVEADVQVERAGRHLAVHAAAVGVQRVSLLEEALGARRVAAVLGQLVPGARHPGRAAPPRHAVDVDELTVELLDPGQELEHAGVPGRTAEHLDQGAQLVVVGGATRHCVTVTVLVDERGRQAERAGGERLGQHLRQLRPLVGRGGAGPGVVAHHVDPEVGVADQRGDVDRGAVATQRVAPLARTTPTLHGMPVVNASTGMSSMKPNTSLAATRSGARTGVSESEQLPVTTVVTPCWGIGSTSGSHHSDGS